MGRQKGDSRLFYGVTFYYINGIRSEDFDFDVFEFEKDLTNWLRESSELTLGEEKIHKVAVTKRELGGMLKVGKEKLQEMIDEVFNEF